MIRKASIEDVDILNDFFTDIIKYEADMYDENNKNSLIIKNYFQNKVINNDYIIYVSEEDNKVVGFISGMFLRGNLVKKTDEVKIDVLYVLDSYRNRGIGSKLIETFINDCKNRKVQYVRIDNFVANEDASRLYEKYGFSPLVIERRKKI